MQNTQTLPLLPLKNTTLFPFLLAPFAVGRPQSLAAVEAALATEEKELVLVAQRNSSADPPLASDLYTIGTKAVIKKMSRSSEEHMDVLVMGVERVMILRVEGPEPFLRAHIQSAPVPEETTPEVEALQRSVMELAAKAIQLAQPQAPAELTRLLMGSEDPLRMVYLLASMLSLDVEKEQMLLEAGTRADALRLMHSFLQHELQVLELRSQISNQARSEMSKEQRDYMLRQQMKAIQSELGESNPEQADVEQLADRLAKADLPDEIRKEAERELGRMRKLPSGAPDYQVIRTYLDFVLELPWRIASEDQLEIRRARQILDDDHHGLEDVKERILEHLGVLNLNPSAKAPILCLVGPPGVGKTSLGQSIAHALGRKFERLSLGGMHDEAELRGHRRTYIGAMPGRIIQAVRRAGANNPVLLMDEVDKLGRDFRGDPASALLEILDPEQNKTFRDNYLDLPFDLSKAFFITTANTLDTIPRPLLDRMETLRLPGYSEEEKVVIAKRYLIPRQIKETGLDSDRFILPDETLRRLIQGYTREAGLRRLEGSIGRLARKVALKFAEGETASITIHPEDLQEMLGPEMFQQEQMRKKLPAGVATGLAWTEAGGDVLYIEATLLPDGNGLTLTGQLGDVMQESVKAARSYIWSHADDFGIDRELFKNSGVHIHVPAGAIPKDGPSAGITAAVALTSVYTSLPARSDTAMTGEITLTGLVFPIGGLKEKVLAARRSGIRRIILPIGNKKDLRELPENVRQEMEFIFAERIEDVLAAVIPQLTGRLALAS